MASKATVQRQRSAEKVIAAGETYQELVSAALSSLYNPATGVAAATVMGAVAVDLRGKTDAMVAADDAHEAELRDDSDPRRRRDTASEALYDCLVTTRRQLDTLCGPAYTAALGFSGKTPSDPTTVLRLGHTVVTNLASVTPPTPLIPEYTFNPEQWRATLLPLVEALDGLAALVATEEREAETTLEAKRTAIEAYDTAFSITANLVSCLLSIAGKDALARRVRPSSRRPGQTAEDAPAEGATAA